MLPIWISLLPLVRSWLRKPPLPEDELYNRYIRPRIEAKGAIAIYFGGRWNVLVARPSAFRVLFAQEKETYLKSGNHIKLPNAVISQLTGGNIISEHGQASCRDTVVAPADLIRSGNGTLRSSVRHSSPKSILRGRRRPQ